MSYQDISAGIEFPDDFFFTVIDIPANHSPVSYEVDKKSGQIFVGRFLSTSTLYPAYYGFIPNTLNDDGDPLDVLLICPCPVSSGVVVRSRPVGVIYTTSETGTGAIIVAVTHERLSTTYSNVKEWEDLPVLLLAQVQHYFEYCKVQEPGKWLKMGRWGTADDARAEICKSVATYIKG
ncbi:inorganic pyrophosphatase [Pseudomonas sp. SJZ080]|uniref:inorganic diphosphatase n=1 Tax=Pseudomonas sp. SJZ080 TaxID=2572888 RepID=UPI00119BED99|nr:inorganic diphosphatase [Pseudomonas sp. SJZ080]TWC55290.1 inorganic pyrophosphatase [Pseudomonas sp. SJZ080]